MTSNIPTPEDFIQSFPHTTLPKITGLLTYKPLKEIRSALKANAASVPCRLGGGANGYLGLILSDDAYANVDPTPFVLPNNPGAIPIIPAGATGPQIAHIINNHNKALREWRECKNVEAALKKQFLHAIEELYVRSKKNANTGFSNVSTRDLLDYCMTTYGSITSQDLELNDTKLKQAWDPSTPFEVVISQIEDAKDYAEAGGQPFSNAQILNAAYNIVFNTGLFFDDCKTWENKAAADKMWKNFKTHFLLAQKKLCRQKQTTQQAGYHCANAIRLAYEETAEALVNLATATSSDRKALETLTNTVANQAQQLKEKDEKIKKLKAQLNNRANRTTNSNTTAIATPTTTTTNTPRAPRTDKGSYCWSHGYLVHANHNSNNCRFPKLGHIKDATRTDNKGGNQQGKP